MKTWSTRNRTCAVSASLRGMVPKTRSQPSTTSISMVGLGTCMASPRLARRKAGVVAAYAGVDTNRTTFALQKPPCQIFVTRWRPDRLYGPAAPLVIRSNSVRSAAASARWSRAPPPSPSSRTWSRWRGCAAPRRAFLPPSWRIAKNSPPWPSSEVLSGLPELLFSSGQGEQALFGAAEGVVYRLVQRQHGHVAALGEGVMLDHAEHGLDPIQLGAVRRQVLQHEAGSLQVRPRRLHHAADVDRGVVQHDHARLGTRRQRFTQEDQQVLRGERAGERPPDQQRGRAVGHYRRQHIQPASLRILVGHPLALPRQHPGVAGRLTRAEPDFIQVDQEQLASRGTFFRWSSRACAATTAAGFRLCRSVRAVRR